MTAKILSHNSKEQHLGQDCPERQAGLQEQQHIRDLLPPASLQNSRRASNSKHLHTLLRGVTHYLASLGKGSSMTHRRGVQEPRTVAASWML